MLLYTYHVEKRLRSQGFTLIELMISLAIAAMIAMIAVPSYQNFILRSKMRTAQADLVSLSVVIENAYQRMLTYPVLAAGTAVPNSGLSADFDYLKNWRPSSPNTDFTFSIVSSATVTNGNPFYTLTATGVGSLSGCKITLTEQNTRATESCPMGDGDWI